MQAKERRKHSRKHSFHPIEYVLENITTDSKLDGVVANISKDGLCLFTTESLKKGQKIILKNDKPAFYKAAMVRWSKKYSDLYYISGLEFIL
jgi:hypothetical protein